MSIPLPPAFVHRIEEQFPAAHSEFIASIERPPLQAILMNPKKLGVSHLQIERPVPWTDSGHILTKRPSFIADPYYHAGHYYSQESSSMIVSHVLKKCLDVDNPVVLDLCAAPGGKSLNILNHLEGNGLLVSNEVIRSRNNILIENISKWGHSNVLVTMNEPSSFSSLASLFDCIVVDAPCSGEGLFRRDPKAREQWSEEAVSFCSSRQKKILADIIPALSPGGLLVYSTCTYAPQENEENVAFLERMGLEEIEIPVEEHWGLLKLAGGGLAFHPHRVPGEGLFISAFRKVDGSDKPRRKSRTDLKKSKEDLSAFIQEDYVCYQDERGHLFHFPAEYLDLLSELEVVLRLTKRGTGVGEMMKGRLVPAHDLALSFIRNEQVPIMKMNLEQAQRYLRRETFDHGGLSDGPFIAKYEEANLGWVKIAAGRMKNHYPKHWRIRKELDAL